jgi:hypothetical protein
LSERELKKTLYPALIMSKYVLYPEVDNSARTDLSDEIEKLIKDLTKVM